MTTGTEGLESVLAGIASAVKSAGRNPQDVHLTVASKTQSAARIRPLLEFGHRVFGENRVQEAQGKWPELLADFPGTDLRMIGPLQSNKAEDAIKMFNVIETLDRISLARALARGIDKTGKQVRLYVEINIGDEPQKAGVRNSEADAFITQCRDEFGLEVEGLMCIPPAGQPALPYFSAMAGIAARNAVRFLSMGMSADFQQAIEAGATHVRVGTAIFGAREHP
jgi:pyridoxal phosphate enzyme (YggS family)